jgi:hypothetical protein
VQALKDRTHITQPIRVRRKVTHEIGQSRRGIVQTLCQKLGKENSRVWS